MMIDKDYLTNQIRAGLEDVYETGIPLDVFPDAIQKIVYELVTYENFNLEYTVSIVLSVFATAIGNALRVNIKGEWVSSCALYMILVGRPGLGKTPPLKFLYSPIRDFDQQMLDKARQDHELSKQQHLGKKGEDSSEQADKPRLTQTVISDFTQEAMLSVHYDNPRGIALVVDEIIALFNSVKRYSAKSNLIQDLLSAYSGTPLKAVRKTEEFPLTIPVPCINIIGSIQTGLLSDVMTKEYVANGLIDRFLFVFPKNRKIPEWQIGIDDKQRPATMSKWISIVRKVIDIPCPVKEDGSTVVPRVLKMSEDAANYFINWNNSIIGAINAIEDDNEVESRKMKLNGNAARLALILQVMRWSVGECQLNCIDIESVKGAIRFVEYFEDCYNRVKASCDMQCPNAKQNEWLELVGSSFTSHEAEMAGERLGISRRTVYNSLKRLSSSDHPLLRRVKQGVYEKIVYECTTAQCTFAQPMDGADENNEVHSAEVQSANKTELETNSDKEDSHE